MPLLFVLGLFRTNKLGQIIYFVFHFTNSRCGGKTLLAFANSLVKLLLASFNWLHKKHKKRTIRFRKRAEFQQTAETNRIQASIIKLSQQQQKRRSPICGFHTAFLFAALSRTGLQLDKIAKAKIDFEMLQSNFSIKLGLASTAFFPTYFTSVNTNSSFFSCVCVGAFQT